MPVSIQFESDDFSGKDLRSGALDKKLEAKFGPEARSIPQGCRSMIANTVTEMRNGMKETCRRIDLEGTAATWAFLRYKHNPADFALLSGGSAPKDEPQAAPEIPDIPEPAAAEAKEPEAEAPASPKAERSPTPASVHEEQQEEEEEEEKPTPKPPPKKAKPAKSSAASGSAGVVGTAEDVSEWLDTIGLPSLKPHFGEANVTGKSLKQLKALSSTLAAEAFIGFLREELGIRRTGDILHLMWSLQNELDE